MRTLLFMTLGGSALALLLLLLRYVLLKKMPSTVYYYAWLLVLLRFALPLPGLVPTQAQQSEARTAAPVYTAAPYEEDAALLAPPLPADLPQTESQSVTERREEPRESAPAVSAAPASVRGRSFDWRSPALWMSVWALGAVFSLGITVCAYLTFTRRLTGTLRRIDPLTAAQYAAIPGKKPALWRSRAVRTPLMYGIVFPKIVLPERSWDSGQLGNILRHELTHYRRRDTIYKWLAVLILSAHWFNPLSYLIRRETGRACELSCDETLLRGMSRAEKLSYGNTLLNTAASGALPAGVVATTFSTEKKNLKERLEQIMTYKQSAARVIAAVLTLALLAGCGLAAGPAAERGNTNSVPDPTDALHVSSVDEWLAAIAPNTLILLDEGEYDLSTASNYGGESDNPYYSWEPLDTNREKPGYELVIRNAENLGIFGAGMEKTTISAEPRYANALKFEGCDGLTLSELTAGHTSEPGFCRGGVIVLENCGDVSLLFCGLYGCGTVGVSAADCHDLSVADCHIYECSSFAVNVSRCRNVRVTGNEVYRHGVREGQGSSVALFCAANTDGFVVSGNSAYENAAQYLLMSAYTKNVFFLSNDVHDNRFESAVFDFEQYPGVVDGCSFRDNRSFESGQKPLWTISREFDIVDRNGKSLSDAALEAMTLEEIDPNSIFPPVQPEQAAAVPAGEEIRVSTADEFLKAIGPARTIVLDGELFDLSSASNYGSKGGEYYYWKQNFDGPGLVIKDVNGLTIRAAAESPDATTVSAVPRYADVLSFVDCEDLTLSGFTAGHTKEPGSCSGGVLLFENCTGVLVERCRLFGCGILGLQTRLCKEMRFVDSVIYECSQGAGVFDRTEGLSFSGCTVRDVPSPALCFNGCGAVSWDGLALVGAQYDIDADGKPVDPLSGASEEEALQEWKQLVDQASPDSIAELENPHFREAAHSYDPDSPVMLFAAEIQLLIYEGNWTELSQRMYYPLAVYAGDRAFHLWTETEFVNSFRNESFYEMNGIDAFRQRVTAASLEEFGDCSYGETFCDHLIAMICVREPTVPDDFRVSCLSFDTPLWPGNPPSAETVAPTPAP